MRKNTVAPEANQRYAVAKENFRVGKSKDMKSHLQRSQVIDSKMHQNSSLIGSSSPRGNTSKVVLASCFYVY